MFKTLKSNWRELVAVLVIVALLFGGLVLLGDREVSENSILSTALAVGISLMGGIAKFVSCLALAWFGLSVTLPEGNKFIVSSAFDDWWKDLNSDYRGFIGLAAAAVLLLAAALCMASSS